MPDPVTSLAKMPDPVAPLAQAPRTKRGSTRTRMLVSAVEVLRERGARADSDRERGRALGLLVRRGYAADDAYAAIRALEHDRN